MAQSPDILVKSLLEADGDEDVNRLITGLPERGMSLPEQPDSIEPVWYTHFDCWNDSGNADYEEGWEWQDPRSRETLDYLLQDAFSITNDKRFLALLSEWPETDQGSMFNKIENLWIQNGYSVYNSDTMCEVYAPPVTESEDEVSDADVKRHIDSVNLWYYYEIHCYKNGTESAGFSVYLASQIKPPSEAFVGYCIPSSPSWEPLIAEALLKGELSSQDVNHLDYIRCISQETYEEAMRIRESAEDNPDPQQYIQQLPARFDYDEVLNRIQMENSLCMDNKAEKRAFLTWIKKNEDLFPDVNLALNVIKSNDAWCTDNTMDMTLFFERLGFKPENAKCPHCGGDRFEPGAPVEDDGFQYALCRECNGSGTRVIDCECDNTHHANDTVCSWCWARGRRHWNDPSV